MTDVWWYISSAWCLSWWVMTLNSHTYHHKQHWHRNHHHCHEIIIIMVIMGVIVTKYSSPHIYHSLFNRALPPLSLLLPIVVTTRPDHQHHPSAHHIVRNHCEYSYSCTFEYLEQYLPDDLSSTQMESIIIIVIQFCIIIQQWGKKQLCRSKPWPWSDMKIQKSLQTCKDHS